MNRYLENSIEQIAENSTYKSFEHIYRIHKKSAIKKWVAGILIALGIILFLPWTQNVRTKGNVTTLRPEQRTQELNNIIAGSVVKWYVKEGDHVNKGDTILQLGEVKPEYFDPQLLKRTQEQIDAKSISAENYKSKAGTAVTQITALTQSRDLKLSQVDIKQKQQLLKVQNDSIDLITANNELSIAKRQADAAQQMLDSGVIALTDFEKRKISFQNALAKRISTENKLLQSKQELINIALEKNNTIQDYTDKISKAQGDRFASLSSAASADADVTKLQNVYAGYDARNKLYYVLAPQSGQIIQIKKAGIGEIVKEGELITEIVPDHFQYAVEMFVNPMDLPLIAAGQKVRFVFDGFPAIVFQGWPAASYGTFGGIVTAIENNTNKDGKFRVLVTEDSTDKTWPPQLRIGGGASGIALLKTVSVWYELWRNINGFPPEYYKPQQTETIKQ
ncbi:HlyD family efflux transporter periplasmic adaptor subunit [Panacibacter ginsenosidivorans]|uniref:HlyD family efflux transporter periplasmic adaptor subunit n=1 Tax=Panacibacter ginsenosidivorans TaxID=1813871 RepID=A0A5B8VAX4_9BACT|nr:HlyD family efflux transporter periplasmic adaptor subunit [Panacibacter ginsenosidivorans]QEC68123.1 HlyD family efflux transporter periplasmic adaptor subunit [Panacibacter ginsenosidivorans]